MSFAINYQTVNSVFLKNCQSILNKRSKRDIQDKSYYFLTFVATMETSNNEFINIKFKNFMLFNQAKGHF